MPICLATVIAFPAINPWLLVAPALGYGLGNLAVYWLLRRDTAGSRLTTVKIIATSIDWICAYFSIVAFSSMPAAATPAVLLLLMVTTSLRFGVLGAMISIILAFLTLCTLLVAQVEVHAVVTPSDGYIMMASWSVVFLVTAIMLGIIQSGVCRWRDFQVQEDHQQSVLVWRLKWGLSRREMEVIQLIADDSLTYVDVGRVLSISPTTVKTHVRRIGEKLGVSGRSGIVAKARRDGLLTANREANIAKDDVRSSQG